MHATDAGEIEFTCLSKTAANALDYVKSYAYLPEEALLKSVHLAEIRVGQKVRVFFPRSTLLHVVFVERVYLGLTRLEHFQSICSVREHFTTSYVINEPCMPASGHVARAASSRACSSDTSPRSTKDATMSSTGLLDDVFGLIDDRWPTSP